MTHIHQKHNKISSVVRRQLSHVNGGFTQHLAPSRPPRRANIRRKRIISELSAGFTLLEVLLSISAISIIAGISIPIYQSLQVRNDLDIAAVSIAQSARRAQVLAQASDGDTSWGIHVASGSITLFQGASYTARITTFDETFDVPTSITPSGLSDVVFAKFTGLPTTTGTATLTSNTNEARNITINSKGMVSY